MQEWRISDSGILSQAVHVPSDTSTSEWIAYAQKAAEFEVNSKQWKTETNLMFAHSPTQPKPWWILVLQRNKK